MINETRRKATWQELADRVDELQTEVKNLKKENEELKNMDLTTVHIKGVCDEKDRWRKKIREKIEEYKKQSKDTFDVFGGTSLNGSISALEDLLKEE